MKETKRKAFNFLRSYFDVLNELKTDKDRLEFLLSIINKQFLNEDPEDLSFIVNLCYQSQRHQIESSVKGWELATKTTLSTTPPTPLGADPPTPKQEEEEKGEEEEKEEYTIPPTTVDGFDWANLLALINKTFGREFKKINDTVKTKYKARIKEGYTKEDITNAMNNCKQDPFHKDNNYKHCTPEYFSRANTLDLHSAVQNPVDKRTSHIMEQVHKAEQS